MSETKPQSYYDLLKVSFYASEDELRRGCESALRRAENVGYGVEPNAAERADIAEKRKQIMQAYAMLKDPARRAKYNAAIMSKLAQPEASASSDSLNAVTSATANPSAIVSTAVGALAATSASASSKPSSAAALNSPTLAKPEVIDLRASMQERATAVISLGNSRDSVYDEPEYAHLGVRFTAMMIDWYIVLALLAVSGFIILPSSSSGPRGAGSINVLWVLAVLLIAVGYYVVGESGKHRSTWGKRWMGLQVLRSDGTEPVSALRAFARYLLRALSAQLFMIGYIMAFFTGRKQTLHDLITDSVVVRTKEPPKYWLLLCIAFVLLGLIATALSEKAASTLVTGHPGGALLKEAKANNQTDPRRATPRQSEVETAYTAAISLQRSLTSHLSTNGKWPTEKETADVINQSTRSEALRDHEVKLMPDGSFMLSLGATAEGTARMIFIPSSSAAGAEWNCLPVNIHNEQTISQCKL